VDQRATARAVLEAIEALDAADSLSGVLDVLADRAAGHAGRVLLVVQGDQALTGWRWHGYTSNPRDTAMLGIPTDDEGLVARAARSGVVEKGSGPAAGRPLGGSHTPDRGAVAVPLAIDGRVVGVLYAEGADAGAEPSGSSPWAEIVEVLARHAARCLESTTARRLPDLVQAAAAAVPIERDGDVGPARHGEPP
jgi:hypothetical protein